MVRRAGWNAVLSIYWRIWEICQFLGMVNGAFRAVWQQAERRGKEGILGNLLMFMIVKTIFEIVFELYEVVSRRISCRINEIQRNINLNCCLWTARSCKKKASFFEKSDLSRNCLNIIGWLVALRATVARPLFPVPGWGGRKVGWDSPQPPKGALLAGGWQFALVRPRGCLL